MVVENLHFFSILSFISKPQNGEIIIDENIKKSVVMLPQNPYLLKRTSI